MASRSGNIPISRGFDTSLCYFHGAEDHYTQTVAGNIQCGRTKTKTTDFWLNDGPAKDLNGTDYSMHMYRDRALSLLRAHDPTTPFFLYLAFANNHEPLECPNEYLYPYPNATSPSPDWRIYQGMITAVDSVIKNVTDLLVEKGMYENSLIIWTSDVGDACISPSLHPNTHTLSLCPPLTDLLVRSCS